MKRVPFHANCWRPPITRPTSLPIPISGSSTSTLDASRSRAGWPNVTNSGRPSSAASSADGGDPVAAGRLCARVVCGKPPSGRSWRGVETRRRREGPLNGGTGVAPSVRRGSLERGVCWGRRCSSWLGGSSGCASVAQLVVKERLATAHDRLARAPLLRWVQTENAARKNCPRLRAEASHD